MGPSHVGYQSAGGLSRLDERLYVARMARSHLHDGNLVRAVEAEQRLGHAHVVVEVALGGHDVVALCEHSRHEFLGCGLAVGARDAYHGYAELPAVLACQQLEGLQAVVNAYHPVGKLLAHVDIFVDDGIAATLEQGILGKEVAVERCALEGQEDASGRELTAVGGDYGVFEI